MSRIVLAAVSAALLVTMPPVVPLSLAAQRTFVASYGSDANACDRVAPCRSFGTALLVTDPDGEILVLDSAGYGRVTIDRSVSIIAPPGVYAGISVFAPDDGIVIDTAGVSVVLRGLTINGQGGNHGIIVANADRVSIENCVISNLGGNGIHTTTAARIAMRNGIVRGHGGYGVYGSGARLSLDRTRIERNANTGVYLTANTRATISRSRIERNGGDGVRADETVAGLTTYVTLSGSIVADNPGSGIGVVANGGSTRNARAHVTDTMIVRNGNGLTVQSFAGGTAFASVADSTVSDNGLQGILVVNPSATLVASGNAIARNGGTGLGESGSGVLLSRGDNTVHDNGVPTSGTITPLSGL